MEQQVTQLRQDLAQYEKIAALDRGQRTKLLQAHHRMNTALAPLLQESNIGMTRKRDRIILELSDQILFAPGSDQIKSAGIPVLRRVGELLARQIQNMTLLVAGHTDNVPIRGGRFPSNWELSAARAVNVVRFFEQETGLPPERLAAVGYGEHRPIASNQEPQGRALNRRIEIILLSQ
jgi:chemotaxis protein MotB